MTFHEFGKEHEKTIVLLHPLGVWWDVFEYVVAILEKDCHLIIPAVPGHDPDIPYSNFTSVEEIASEIEGWLIANRYSTIDCLYGCSMGGALVSRILADGIIKSKCAVIDGGITPYRFPKVLTYAIGVRDFCMTELGKHSDIRFLKSVFDPDKYSEDDLRYVKKILHSMSAKRFGEGFIPATITVCLTVMLKRTVLYTIGTVNRKRRLEDRTSNTLAANSEMFGSLKTKGRIMRSSLRCTRKSLAVL